MIPPDTVLRMNQWMLTGDVPVLSGLYFTKSVPSEPLIYRGRGNGHFTDWKIGEEVWVDGIPMGCTLIHSSVLKLMYDESEEYVLRDAANNECRVRAIFETPAKVWFDPEQHNWFTQVGTEDLKWCSRVMKEKVLERAGWPEVGAREFPFLLDTNIFCTHIDFSGIQYPSKGEHMQFMSEKGEQNGGEI